MNENIGNGLEKLAPALVKAQGAFHTVPKTGVNPHLGNRYATLDDIIAAVREPLAKNGLSFVQLLGNGDAGELVLRTMLIHESGQTLSTEIVINSTGESRGINNLQAFGSAVTYMKRYTLGAMLGIATGEDTDAEGAASAAPARRQDKKPARAKDGEPVTNGKDKCPLCHASGAHHAPWCQETETGERVDTRKAA